MEVQLCNQSTGGGGDLGYLTQSKVKEWSSETYEITPGWDCKAN